MGRRRKAGNGLYPAGVYPSRGWLFHRDQAGKWHKICRVEDWQTKNARDRWAELSTGQADAGTVGAMLEGYLSFLEDLLRRGGVSKRHFEDSQEYAKHLRPVFGAMLPHEVTSRDVLGYLRKRSWQPPARKNAAGELVLQAPRLAPVRANKEISSFSRAYAWAMGSPDWPRVSANPCIGVDRNPTKAKERCPEIWEIDAAKRKARGAWPLIFDFAYKCGQRGVQTRMLPKTAICADGIRPPTAKGGDAVLIEWDDELVAIVLGLLEHTAEVERELHVTSPYVIVSRTGQPYTEAGWKTTMYKIVRAALKDPENPLEQPFSFHDFRARSGTDEEQIYGRSAQGRMGHKRRATTDKYIRGRRTWRVKPLPLRRAS
jgi:hypothetical protein